MSNPDRYWESAIAEAASGRQPPDQTAEILARLNAPALRGWAARPWPVRVAIHAAQTALAAGVLLAIGLATGVVRWRERSITLLDEGLLLQAMARSLA